MKSHELSISDKRWNYFNTTFKVRFIELLGRSTRRRCCYPNGESRTANERYARIGATDKLQYIGKSTSLFDSHWLAGKPENLKYLNQENIASTVQTGLPQTKNADWFQNIVDCSTICSNRDGEKETSDKNCYRLMNERPKTRHRLQDTTPTDAVTRWKQNSKKATLEPTASKIWKTVRSLVRNNDSKENKSETKKSAKTYFEEVKRALQYLHCHMTVHSRQHCSDATV